MHVNGVLIEDTFAEAFPMRAARIVITAVNERWAREAALKLTGFATSVIACKCEAAIERELTPDETPDARPGVSALVNRAFEPWTSSSAWPLLGCQAAIASTLPAFSRAGVSGVLVFTTVTSDSTRPTDFRASISSR